MNEIISRRDMLKGTAVGLCSLVALSAGVVTPEEAIAATKKQTIQYATITLKGGVGVRGSKIVRAKKNSFYTLPNCTWTKSGYTFSRWDAGKAGARIYVRSNITITAQWQAKTYKVCFNRAGGTGSNITRTGKTGSRVYAPGPNTVKKKGYKLTGWKCDNYGTVKPNGAYIVSAKHVFPGDGNDTIYFNAVWKRA